jgi:hypothetical protein
MYTTFSINLGLLILGGLYYLYNAKTVVYEGKEEPTADPVSARARAAANAAGSRSTGPPGLPGP